MVGFAVKNEAGDKSVEKAHGRLEARKFWQNMDRDWVENKKEGKALKNFCMREAQQEIKGEDTLGRKYQVPMPGQ